MWSEYEQMTLKDDEIIYFGEDGFVVNKKPFIKYRPEDKRSATHNEIYEYWFKRKSDMEREIIGDLINDLSRRLDYLN